MAPRRVHLSLLLALVGCGLDVEPGLDGLRVTGGNLEAGRSVEWPVGQPLELWFSAPLDPHTVHERSVALVPWEPVGDCRWTPICEEGVCARGTCWDEPLGAGELADLDAGIGVEGWPVEVQVLADSDGLGSRLRVRPRRALPAHTLVELVIGDQVRGSHGTPMVDRFGHQARVRRTLVTADEGSSGPEARLVSPVPGEHGVPTNLAVVETGFAVPVPSPAEGASLTLEAEVGPDVVLRAPEPCPGWVPGACLRWEVADRLRPETRYRVGGGGLRDRNGAVAQRPAAQTWFRTGAGPDDEPPQPVGATWRVDGPCLLFRVWVGEAVAVELAGAGIARARIDGIGWLQLGLPLAELEAGPVVATLRDRAGGEAAIGHEFAGASAPALAITEVLANPLGPEPDGEFIEVVAMAATGTDGLRIADRPWSEILTELDAGLIVGDPLPAAWLEAGEVAIVVAAGYPGSLGPGDPADPAALPGTLMLEVDASLGQGGLKNSGEVISLFRADPPQLLSSYGDWLEPGSGVSAVRPDPQACDTAAAWQAHPEGRSGPGRLP